MSHKIDQKELRHDGLVDTVTLVSMHIQRHSLLYLIGVVCVAVATVLVGVFVYQGNRQKATAREALAQAETPAQLAEIARRYQSSPEAPLALLRLADLVYGQEEYAAALQNYQTFLNRYGAHPLADMAQMGKGYSLEGQQRWEEAALAYRELPAKYPNSSLFPEALYNSARCLIHAGRNTEGLNAYRQLVATYPRSVYARFAQDRYCALAPAVSDGG
ncbi:MAG TPA: tetratricopeptide repeat protein [bacterium]|mgnify:CR=1 FL=1|nr:tetratricopeptide repeat protein [bacterium]HPJ71311.1 tetratricopeptide repeat protein [bacterium]HPQ65431.1 tetratricopeptide repeat protein [bacterium]